MAEKVKDKMPNVLKKMSEKDIDYWFDRYDCKLIEKPINFVKKVKVYFTRGTYEGHYGELSLQSIHNKELQKQHGKNVSKTFPIRCLLIDEQYRFVKDFAFLYGYKVLGFPNADVLKDPITNKTEIVVENPLGQVRTTGYNNLQCSIFQAKRRRKEHKLPLVERNQKKLEEWADYYNIELHDSYTSFKGKIKGEFNERDLKGLEFIVSWQSIYNFRKPTFNSYTEESKEDYLMNIVFKIGGDPIEIYPGNYLSDSRVKFISRSGKERFIDGEDLQRELKTNRPKT